MKFGKKTFLFFAVFIALIFFCSNVSAVNVSDETEDVWKQKLGSWESTTSRENVDITSLSYEISDSEITATLTVKGEIQSDANHVYYIYLENSSVGYYAMLAAGQGTWMNEDNYLESGSLSNPVSGNTFTANFEISDSNASFDLWGYAMETVDGTEAYWDYAPNSYAPYYDGSSNEQTEDEGTDSNGADNTQNGEDQTATEEGETDTGSENTEDNLDSEGDAGSDTPGFEILTAFAAISIALILLKKRK